MPPHASPKLFAQPLATWERDGLQAAVEKAGLPGDDLRSEGPLFWRFLADDDVLAGFGGLEMHGRDALLRSVVVLPPLRRRHFGSGIVRLLETEARVLGGRTIWVATEGAALFFERLGYSACAPEEMPEAVRASSQFRRLDPPATTAMMRRLP